MFKELFIKNGIKRISLLILALLAPAVLLASGGNHPSIGPVRLEFIFFGLILLGVALFHKHTFWVALIGLTVLMTFKLVFDPGFHLMEHFFGTTPMAEQLMDKEMRQGEWGIILNLLGLLLGFGILSKIFEESGVPDILPKYLPDDWKGPFLLLVFVFILSSFLDNIAAALIGGTVALVVFKNRVHIGYIAALVAASNAGGSGSVVGDTTTTMMWIDGVSALNVLHAYVAAVVALLIFAWFGAHQQDKYQKIQSDPNPNVTIDWAKLFIVALILAGAIISNIVYDMPALGVWIAIIIGAFIRKAPWREVPASLKGTIFLLCLVTCASLMPVEELPNASWVTAFSLGFLSSVFDNIPLTKLCLEQGHYDWGMLAYCVGFGGSMIWFGSSAGVAITNKFPEGRNVLLWVKNGWHIIVAYIIGFFALFLTLGWEPADNKEHKIINCPVPGCPMANKPVAKVQAVSYLELLKD
ncbi:MAG TPA: SLC13 family permease [Bacteroidales bacterium]|jgi:Na+/H+ antiporter NhaD/arsenite permease-like protein|nr:citrate transporter [Bacteroidales bacterium]HNY52264.1 SLC13 family permease [Bacteroidales bacterium]HOG56869.1 SLC13 family permease [Bacteroidales bacterium]